jgi:hypothetical protein
LAVIGGSLCVDEAIFGNFIEISRKIQMYLGNSKKALESQVFGDKFGAVFRHQVGWPPSSVVFLVLQLDLLEYKY